MERAYCVLVLAAVAVSGCGGEPVEGLSFDPERGTTGGALEQETGGMPPDPTSGVDSTSGGPEPPPEDGATTTATTASGDSDGHETSATGDSTGADPPSTAMPPANASFDYQLGGAYPPPNGVLVVSRDRHASPAAGLYNFCYVNGFQTQPGEEDWWLDEHPDLLLRDDAGELVIDPDWDEMLLDVTTAEKREALAEIVGGWIEACADDGFDAIEIDNLDTFARSDGLISEDDAVAFMALLSDVGHGAGLAMAQKNSAEIVDRREEMGTDFAVAEECNRWEECEDYVDVYGDLVFVIEYRQMDFADGCRNFPELSIVLRDLQLVPPGGGYVFDGC